MKYDVVVIGAGIVGLATAYRLLEKKPGLKICVLEKEKQVAAHQTGHNSGVMHSGIYYKPGSLKAINCVNGYNQLKAFAEQHNIPFDICGKIIVATKQEQLPILDGIFKRGNENGLKGLRKISKEEIIEIEPHVTTGAQGIVVPQAGIINYKTVAQKLAEIILQQGGEILFGAKVEKITVSETETVVQTTAGDYTGAFLINCAGLYSDTIARLTHPALDMRIIPFRGEYYVLKKEKEHLVRNLIYPVPDPNFPFLGVHFTRMIEGGIEAGPNAVLAFRKEGYTLSDFHAGEFFETLGWPGFRKIAFKYWRTELRELHRSFSKAAFVKALQELIPEITPDDLEDGGSGVRAQAVDRAGNLVDDFAILESKRVLNVCNAPSPAATSCLSIGEHIAGKAVGQMS
ncbi:MAG: L-2-hydroxyglutarate oxidase [Chitinophagales bacterium]|nr:L-2-hydroxyglutarate oxidase [Chitinophagales bacterium]